MIGADLERLVSPHDQPDLGRLLVLQESYVSCPTLLPFLGLLFESE